MRFCLDQGSRSGVLINSKGDETYVAHHIEPRFFDLIQRDLMDTLIIERESGFSQFGAVCADVASLLGRDPFDPTGSVRSLLCSLDIFDAADCQRQSEYSSYSEPEFSIPAYAGYKQFDGPSVTLEAIASRKPDSPFKGLVFVPSESSLSYHRYSNHYSKPYRDYFYNVTYESLYYSYHVWSSRKFVIAHLGFGKNFGKFKSDITMCQAEAVRHFCECHGGVLSVVFWDISDGNEPLSALSLFDSEPDQNWHRSIVRSVVRNVGRDFIHIKIPDQQRGSSKISLSTRGC